MEAAIIATPTDMRPFVGSHDCVRLELAKAEPEFEPEMRHAVDALLSDLQYIGADDQDLVSSYLDGVGEPLQTLRELGVSVLGIKTSGTLTLSDGNTVPNWTRCYVITAPTLAYFQIDGTNKRFHRFAPACSTAMSDLLDAARGKDVGIRVSLNVHVLRHMLENNVPWCETCCLEESLGIADGRTLVQQPELRVTSPMVKIALLDAESLLTTRGPTSAVDRLHTALHGHLKTLCTDATIPFAKDASVSDLFGVLRRTHPKLQDLGPHQEQTAKVLRSLAAVMDALGTGRNRGSMAHANEELLDRPEAWLFIDATRSILRYLDSRISD